MTRNQTIALLAFGFAAIMVTRKTSTVHLIAEAIGYVESRGNYRAIGKPTRTGARAYGKYQVMDFNIPVWSKEIIGRAVTPDEWLASGSTQDTVVRAKLAQYYERYGNAADVASMWFSGRPLAKAGASADVTGTTVPQYVQLVLSRLNA